MKKFFLFFVSILLILCCSSESKPDVKKPHLSLPEKSIVITNQANSSVSILDASDYSIIWTWTPQKAGVPVSEYTWFSNPSEVKPVYNRKYILMTASGGAVALIRIADSKLMFYAYAGQNPHSAEVLPDGNVAVATSTDGKLNTFVTDTVKGKGEIFKSYNLPSAHNVVWDKERQRLYTTEGSLLYSYKYNNDKKAPSLTSRELLYELPSSETCAHDLYPVNGEKDMLWLTTNENVWKYDVVKNEITKVYPFYGVKSVSDSPDGVLMLYPVTEWWSDGLIGGTGKKLFSISGAKIYKGRWMRDNTFSYPVNHNI